MKKRQAKLQMRQMNTFRVRISAISIAAMVFAGGVNGVTYAESDRSVILPDVVNMMPRWVFSPAGFDNNDNAQIVLHSEYPNTCYKVGPTTHVVDPDAGKITIRDSAYFYDGFYCLMMLVPYQKTVDLGPVPAGTYDVVVEDEDGSPVRSGRLKVGVSTNSGPDDHLYAAVSGVWVEQKKSGSVTLKLKGEFTDSCMSLKEVRTLSGGNRITVVLPIAEMADRDDCGPTRRPFEKIVELKGLEKGKALFHVRALNGSAVNQVAEIF